MRGRFKFNILLAMEYSVYITYKCNLRCSFCYVKKKISLYDTPTLTDEHIEQIIKYISTNKNGQKDRVMFFGGEPLIDYEIIKKFINKSGGLNLSYGIYTNGLLLNSVPLDFLKLLDIFLISIDGDKKAHEKYRGQTYKKIVGNIKKIKPKLDSLIIGRVTVTEETNIYKSVKSLINDVDAVHWQIVNKPQFNDTEKFINNYRTDIKELFDFWLFNFKRDKLLNIIPFQAIIASLIFNYPKNNWSFRCGTGSELQTIDIDGNIYYCDEYVGNKKALK